MGHVDVIATPDGRIHATALGATAPADLLGLVQPPPWHGDALCKEYPHVNFVLRHGEPIGPALDVCCRCSVRDECLEYALRQGTWLVGVWGGTTQNARRAILKATA